MSVDIYVESTEKPTFRLEAKRRTVSENSETKLTWWTFRW
ncbi:hypothetical protein HSB1_46430 [Halogranum salarium B-1]|uniref:Uncharacterized protein n=1 Tax=Halogranum salarium B-1 TaxID=1210908 RepID=J3ET70_9EURY|nr:hypothetical protein HSB1_46430 [Halogranum salarium B-1]